MYFPYLRGRQYELIALRELLENGLISDKIIPIVEPIKLSTTLFKTMRVFVDKNRDLGLIHNPKVGNFMNDLAEDSLEVEKFFSLIENREIIKTHIVNKDSIEEIVELEKIKLPDNKTIAIILDRDYIEIFKEIYNDIPPMYTLTSDERVLRREIKTNKVLIEDRYTKRSRNVDYFDVDEFFSDDHKYYNDEDYVGFSDYSIVGDEYSESGFAPRAVAIHITYFDENKDLRIKHFVSDSNENIEDPGGKFYEAVSKLYEWQKHNSVELTYAMKKFIQHYENGTYPGLGQSKKLSIMHHIQLINDYLVEKD